tara:strand:- start:437 stop:586 length:150 start_codon:yes stop_codon:yes gene_type:complete
MKIISRSFKKPDDPIFREGWSTFSIPKNRKKNTKLSERSAFERKNSKSK